MEEIVAPRPADRLFVLHLTSAGSVGAHLDGTGIWLAGHSYGCSAGQGGSGGRAV
ncbi:MAG: hypothetical protein V3R89_07830 [Thermoanaerobaculia bacterium]